VMSAAVAPAVVKTGMPAALRAGAKLEGASVPVAKTGVQAVLMVETKVEGASVVVLVLVGLLVELFVMVAMMTMLEIHPLVPPPISAEVATAAATTTTTAPGKMMVVMSAAVAPAVVKTCMPAALRAGAKVEGASVPVAKTGVLAVLRVETKVEGASVVVLVLVGLLVELFVMVAMMTMLKIHPLVPPPISAEVATAAATTTTTAPGEVVVMSAAVAPAVVKTGMPAALRAWAKVEGASVLVLVLVGLLVGKFALAPVVILLE